MLFAKWKKLILCLFFFKQQPDQYIRNGPPALNLGSLGYYTLWEALDLAGFVHGNK